jgi:hypothetical protein
MSRIDVIRYARLADTETARPSVVVIEAVDRLLRGGPGVHLVNEPPAPVEAGAELFAHHATPDAEALLPRVDAGDGPELQQVLDDEVDQGLHRGS